VGTFRKNGRVIGWLALVAMLGNVLLAFAPARAAHLGDDTQVPVMICTPDGMQTLAREGNGPEPEYPSRSHCPSCTLVKCFVLAFPPLPPEILPPPQSVLHFNSSPTLGAVSRLKLGGIGSRAPPAFT
jgi:hypothetical protein